MFFIMRVDYWTWRTWSKILIAVCFLLLVLVLIPGIGMERNGSRSWIGVGAFSIQPSEFMKLAMIAFLAKFLSEKQKNITSFRKGFAPALGIVFSAFAIIIFMTGPRYRNGYGWNLYYYDICFRCENRSLYLSRSFRA